MGDAQTKLKTTDVRGRDDEIIKPNELVHIIETKPLTLEARRIYNLLIANAWDRIEEPVVHCIRKSDLRGLHNGNDRIVDGNDRRNGSRARREKVCSARATADGQRRRIG